MGRSVHIIIGTKAQFIKMAPIAYLMEQVAVPYRILDLSQHGALTAQIVADFGLTPDIRFVNRTGANVATYSAAIRWIARNLRQLSRRRATLRSELLLSRGTPSVALIHGDTLSTLVGSCLARRLGLQVGLVEAGLSSGRLLSPFPEEAIRRHVETNAEFLFAAGDTAEERLRSRQVSGRILNTSYNSGFDAFSLIASKMSLTDSPNTDTYGILTIHRAETITRRGRLRAVVEHVCRLADQLPRIRFLMHEPTLRALRRAGVAERVEAHPNINVCPLVRYPEFVRMLIEADFVLTDGGSVQEEASYARKPCLILRNETEREHGIGTTAKLMTLDAEEDLTFLASVHRHPYATHQAPRLEASRVILRGIGALH